MITFLVTLRQLGQSLGAVFKAKEGRSLGILALGLLALGTIFYMRVEGFTLIDSLYFCFVTLTTIGYGDFSPVTTFGKLFTMIYSLFGLGIMTLLISEISKGYLAQRKDKNQ